MSPTAVLTTLIFRPNPDVVYRPKQAAALTDTEIAAYVSPALFPVLRIMMLMDNDAYAFFDPDQKEKDRVSTRQTFEPIPHLIGVQRR